MKKSIFFVALSSLLLLSACGGYVASSPPPPLPVASHFSVAPSAAAANAGTPFNVTVSAFDASNSLVSSYSGTVHLTFTDSQATVQPSSLALTNGAGTFSVTFKTAGPQTITAADSASTPLTGSSDPINISAGPATHLSVTAPSPVTAGLGLAVNVTAFDAFNNVAITYSGTVHLSSTDPQAILPPNSTLINGSGTFSPATLNTVGSETITATDIASASLAGTSSAINVVSNAATHFFVTGNPISVFTRATFRLNVTAEDAANNVAMGYSGTVHFSSTDPQAMLPANSTLTAGSSFYSVTLETTGNQTITATDTAAASVTGNSSAIAVLAAPALAISSGNPPDGTVGVDYGPTRTDHFLCHWFFNRGWSLQCSSSPCDPLTTCGSHPPCGSVVPNGICIRTVVAFTGFTLIGTGGVPPYKFSASGLPPGLSLNLRNEIVGTPAAPATYSVNVSVTDSGVPPAPLVTATYQLKIALPPMPVISTTPPPPPGVVNQPYSFTFQASGYPPLSWSESGALPAGLTFNNSSALLSGIPTAAGPAFPISVTATDQFNQSSAPANFNLAVSLHGFQAASNMSAARQKHTATLLGSGKVLIAGGEPDDINILATAELFDPASGTFALTGSMTTPRIQHAAALLPNGKVLVVGGRTGAQAIATATAEIFDPAATGSFNPTGSMATARATPTATLLNNGMVLVTGGAGANVSALATAELYDPSTGNFEPAGPMGTARNAHTATLLANGKVLVTGGVDANSNHLQTAELFDPATRTITAAPGMMTATRAFHTATLLSSGKVLIAGGVDDTGKARSTAELFDPVSGRFAAISGNMVSAHADQTATLLSDGTVLLAGGFDANLNPLAAVELFDPASESFGSTGSLVTARHQHTATLLNNGKVFVTGGTGTAGVLASAELYQ